ncbi:MAG: NHL repeat-containing protein [Solirubrobacterales bacterium]
MRRLWLAAICMAALGLVAASPAQAAFDDPLFFFTPQPPPEPPIVPPPFGYLNGPCGLTVNSEGRIYVSDYYHRVVDVFAPSQTKPTLKYDGQPLSAYSVLPNPHAGPVDDPCGLALDSSGALYLNNYHRNVIRFPAPVSLANANDKAIDSGDPSNVYANPTGVAVDPAANAVYVDDRTYVASYNSAGTALGKIGEGTLQDGYGIAVSGFPATAGYLYVPDAATKTVKVYNPAVETTNPIASFAKPGGFGSLVDSAIAVDNSTGEAYVIDTIDPQLSERPQAIVYVFSAAGVYEGRLKRATINAAPTGLAVDNSGGDTQGRVYVTSGIAEEASIYAYPPHAATSASAPPLGLGSSPEGTSASARSSGSAAAVAAADAVPETALSLSPSSSQAQARRAARKSRRARRHHHRHRTREAHRAKRDRR